MSEFYTGSFVGETVSESFELGVAPAWKWLVRGINHGSESD